MKTAVIYSGQTRSFRHVFENQYLHVLRKLTNPEFFVSVAEHEQAPDMSRLLERFPADKVHIEVVKQPQIPEPLPDKPYLAMYPPSASPQAILRQLWHLNRAFGFMLNMTQHQPYDVVVRIRPDLAFYRCDLPLIRPGPTGCITPWWARWGGVNDRFALLGWTAASHYFGTFENWEKLMRLGWPLHPETLIAASLELGGISPSHTLATEFATVRIDGTVIPPSVTETDKVEYGRTRP